MHDVISSPSESIGCTLDNAPLIKQRLISDGGKQSRYEIDSLRRGKFGRYSGPGFGYFLVNERVDDPGEKFFCKRPVYGDITDLSGIFIYDVGKSRKTSNSRNTTRWECDHGQL